jgi:hypothetical protein
MDILGEVCFSGETRRGFGGGVLVKDPRFFFCSLSYAYEFRMGDAITAAGTFCRGLLPRR